MNLCRSSSSVRSRPKTRSIVRCDIRSRPFFRIDSGLMQRLYGRRRLGDRGELVSGGQDPGRIFDLRGGAVPPTFTPTPIGATPRRSPISTTCRAPTPTATDCGRKPCTYASIEQLPTGTFRKRNAPCASATSVLVVLPAPQAKATRTPSPDHVPPSASVNVTVPTIVALGPTSAMALAGANTVSPSARKTLSSDLM